MSEKILDNMAAAGETAYMKENACVMHTTSRAVREAIIRAKNFAKGSTVLWAYAGFVAVDNDIRHFWASDLGFVAASKAWIKRYDKHGDWIRTWRIKSK